VPSKLALPAVFGAVPLSSLTKAGPLGVGVSVTLSKSAVAVPEVLLFVAVRP
jgi:hypothetical protein